MGEAPGLPGLCLAALWLFILGGCGSIEIDPTEPEITNGPFQRIYVNDAAAGDSLRRAIVEDGIQFVLQPGNIYSLSLQGALYSKRTLQLYRFDNGRVKRDRSLREINSGGQGPYFELTSPHQDPTFYVARLSPPGEEPLNAFSRVRLQSLTHRSPDSLRVRLVFVGRLTELATQTARAQYAETFFANLRAIYGQAGINISGSMESAGEASKFTVVTWENRNQELPGTRQGGHLHLYLVEEIRGPSIGDFGQGTILGLAPLEAHDLDRESRVLLSNKILDPIQVAVTAAHEVGHFFGLRHTVATSLDLEDGDYSNRDDGFADTPYCEVETGIALARMGEFAGERLCLRVAADNCSRTCQLTNLMHPFDCRSEVQTQLSPSQIDFLRKNVSLYQ